MTTTEYIVSCQNCDLKNSIGLKNELKFLCHDCKFEMVAKKYTCDDCLKTNVIVNEEPDNCLKCGFMVMPQFDLDCACGGKILGLGSGHSAHCQDCGGYNRISMNTIIQWFDSRGKQPIARVRSRYSVRYVCALCAHGMSLSGLSKMYCAPCDNDYDMKNSDHYRKSKCKTCKKDISFDTLGLGGCATCGSYKK